MARLLAANRLALAITQPARLSRLEQALPESRVGSTPAGELTWRPYRHPMTVVDEHTALALAAAVEADRDGEPLWMLGIGRGEHVRAVLEHTAVQVVLFEPDLALWQAVLATEDLSRWLRCGRLEIRVGVADLPSAEARHRWVHPGFSRFYGWMDSLFGEGPLVLALRGELFVDDTVEAFVDAGWRVWLWDASHQPESENLRTLRCGASLVWAINTRPGLCEAAADAGVPVAIWEIDPTTDGPARLARRVPDAAVFTYRRAHVSRLRRAGYGHVQYLPLAANASRLARPVEIEPVPVSFVGASMVRSAERCKAQLCTWVPAGPARQALQAVLDDQRRDLDTWRVPELLERALPGLRAQVMARGGGLDIAQLLGEVLAAERRLTTVAHLGALGVQVWGDEGWSLLAQHGVTWRGWADHFVQVPAIYQGSTINVDIPRLYQDDIVTMRVFDVLAAGGFLLTAPSGALAECFTVGAELETYASVEELVDKCSYYLAHPEQRARVAAAGQARVLSAHTMRHRLREIGTALGLAALAPQVCA